MINQDAILLFSPRSCATAAARQGKPAGGAAVLSNIFTKALYQLGAKSDPILLYIMAILPIYFNVLENNYSGLIGKFLVKLPNSLGIFSSTNLCH